MSNWHEQVYYKPIEEPPENWKEIRNMIIARDLKCYRCETRQLRKLTVHHLIPRKEGGGNNPENLITLCGACHDIAEMAGCRSLDDILATIEEPEIRQLPEKVLDREETFERPAWHAWVYGGQRRQT
jgi:hypothetical protein